MTITAKIYGLFFKSAFNKELDWDTDTWKTMLTTATYTPDQDTHQYKSSVTNEVSGTGYTATGATMTSLTVTYTSGTNVLMLDADDVSWTTSTITARTAVVYDASPGTDATRPLACYQQSDVDIVSTGGTFQIVWAAAGIITVTVA